MNRQTRLATSLLLVAAPMLAGCAVAERAEQTQDQEPLAQSEQALLIAGYNYSVIGFLVEALGIGLNGTALNGAVLDGHVVVYASLSGVQSNGTAISKVTLQGTELSGRLAGGKHIHGKGFEGVQLPGVLEDGSTLPITIDSIDASANKTDKDVSRMQVSYHTKDGHRPLCGLDQDGDPIPAIPLSGRPDTNIGAPGGGGWVQDPSAMTFACEGYVLAKCVDLGYKPWREGKVCTKKGGCETISLAGYHQACTRMLRADYCGDGKSHTVDGVAIGMYDAFGIRLDGNDWPLEAEWTAGGARCAAQPRVPGLPLPACWNSLTDPTCGDLDHFNTGTLIMNELAP